MIRKNYIMVSGLVMAFTIGYIIIGYSESPKKVEIANLNQHNENINSMAETNLKLGAFSVSLSVKDLKASKAFYEKLGFKVNGGNMDMNYLIMKNEHSIIGLFQGMFDENILTFNPGWDENARNIDAFDDVRVIQKKLKDQGLKLITEAPDSTEGPASFMVSDPDGNVILVDQHR